MGRYMRKAKITNDTIALVTDLSLSNTNTTVRTRAKTLALQQQQQNQATSNCSPRVNSSDPSSYLQLRSRRLERSNLFGAVKLKKSGAEESFKGHKTECSKNPNPRIRNVKVGFDGAGLISCKGDEKSCFGDVGEGSFGENDWEFQARDGSTRESTPCNLIRGSDTIGTPGSSTRPAAGVVASNQRSWSMMQQIPTTREMEDFFTFAQQEQQRLFTEKYNFDVVNDLPLPGRYEWVSVHP